MQNWFYPGVDLAFHVSPVNASASNTPLRHRHAISLIIMIHQPVRKRHACPRNRVALWFGRARPHHRQPSLEPITGNCSEFTRIHDFFVRTHEFRLIHAAHESAAVLRSALPLHGAEPRGQRLRLTYGARQGSKQGGEVHVLLLAVRSLVKRWGCRPVVVRCCSRRCE